MSNLTISCHYFTVINKDRAAARASGAWLLVACYFTFYSLTVQNIMDDLTLQKSSVVAPSDRFQSALKMARHSNSKLQSQMFFFVFERELWAFHSDLCEINVCTVKNNFNVFVFKCKILYFKSKCDMKHKIVNLESEFWLKLKIRQKITWLCCLQLEILP